MARTVWLVCGVLLFLLLVFVGVRLQQMPVNDVSEQNDAPTAVAGVPVGGAFSLIDHTGKPVTNSDYADKFKLIFFGFTWCPSVCPTELAKMSDVLEKLGPLADRIIPIFISIDPERDTPDIMREYLKHFDDRIIGLTGSRPQIDTVVKSYKAYAVRIDSEDGNYTMDHSSFMYLMSPDDDLVTLYRAEEKPDQIVADLSSRLK